MRGRLFLFGSLLVVFLMLMVPSIGAVEYSVAEKVNKDFYLSRVKTFLSGGLIDIIALIEMILAIILANAFMFIYTIIWVKFILPHMDENPLLVLFLLGVLIVPGIVFGVCKIIQHQLGWSNRFTRQMFSVLLQITGVIGIILSIVLYIIYKYTHPTHSLYQRSLF